MLLKRMALVTTFWGITQCESSPSRGTWLTPVFLSIFWTPIQRCLVPLAPVVPTGSYPQAPRMNKLPISLSRNDGTFPVILQ